MTFKKIILLAVGISVSSFLYSQEVDNFTGDFSYTIPLLSVPSPDGAAIPIIAGYSAGISVNQAASEIGLGWNLSTGGAINRSVSGLPDDWKDADVANLLEKDFVTHRGPLHFKDGRSDILDIYTSTWKIDTPMFYFPDYDKYFVSGPGFGGVMQPYMFEYAEIERKYPIPWIPACNCHFGDNTARYWLDNDPEDAEDFYKKPQFMFQGDFAGTLYSRYYPDPTDISTDAIYASSAVPGEGFPEEHPPVDFEGEDDKGYNDELYSETANKNRLWGTQYVEYFTNAEIDNNEVNNLINFETGHERSSYPQDGVGAFRITDANGFTYHYSLPVYINYTVNGNYPLKNDYSAEYNFDNFYNNVATVTNNDGYITRDLDIDLGSFEHPIVEYKQDAKYAYQWLLTAVTGPDYVDVNTNNIVDASDKGYWVSYDYRLWSADFIERGPFYGYQNVFAANEGDGYRDAIIDTEEPWKTSGRLGIFNTTSKEIYYLNKINTSTHSAIFVRDIRDDEHSAAPYYDDEPKKIGVMDDGTQTTDALYGTLYDNGGSSGDYVLSLGVDQIYTISPASADQLRFKFLSFEVGTGVGNYDYVYIYDGNTATGSPIYTFNTGSNDLPGSDWIEAPGGSITIKFSGEQTSGPDAGFAIAWEGYWGNDWAKTAPQLRLDKIILMENDDLAGITTPDSIIPASNVWNMGATTNSDANFYDIDWYNDYSSTINAATLKSVEFEQDYSLARKYYNNIKVHCSAMKNESPDEVKAALVVDDGGYVSSGKLTLNEVILRDVGAVQKTPSHLFDYNKDYSLDNPDYDPEAMDNWGYYKKDVTEKGLSNYTTLQSKNYTDAWSLRKITTPLGGTVHVEYESDSYQKVFEEDGGLRGPSRTYLIENVTQVSGKFGEEWYYELEDEVEDFTQLANNAPEGTIVKSFIPFTTPEEAEDCYVNSEYYINTGTTTFTTNQNKVATGTFLRTDATEFDYESQANPNTYFTTSPATDCGGFLKYTGNGYFYFELPVGEEAYGGGIRVKRITINNCTNDTYRQEYTYEGGITPSEPDRLELPKKIKDADQDLIDIKARANIFDKHRMQAGVGYTNVTVKNMGQTNSPQGALVYNFITEPGGIDNFEPTIIMDEHAAVDDGCVEDERDTTHIIDVADKFSALWGRMASSTVTDVNDNIISFSKNTYETMRQGTIVENYDFVYKYCPGCELPEPPENPCTSRKDVICILRNYPAMLTKREVYDKGVKNTTEYLEFDDVTWSPSEISNTDMSNDVTLSTVVPAFRVSEYAGTGSKAVDQDNTNQFGFTYSTKTVVNPDITSNDDFKSQSVKTIKQDYTVRKFNSTYYEFRNGAVTDSYWVGDRAYAWAGPLGTFGLYDETAFVAFDPTDAPGSVDPKWRYAGETSIFDEKRRVLENKSFGDKYSATKFGYSDKFPIASGSNVNFESFTHTSFEDKFTAYSGYDYYGGEVKHQNATVATTSAGLPAHTGNKYIIVGSGQVGPMFIAKNISANNQNLMTGRTYRASVWVHTASQADATLYAELNGHDGVSVVSQSVYVRKDDANGITNGVWKLITLDIEIPENYVSSSGGGNNDFRVYVKGGASGNSYFDDLRVQPVEAGVSAAVYDEHTGRVTYTLDNNNFATKMVYDEAGNVIETYKEIEGLGLKKLSAVEYEFAR